MRQLRALAVTPRLLGPFSRPASVKNTPSRGTPLALPPCLQILQAKAAEKPQQTRARSATPADQQDALNPIEASTPPLAHPSLKQRASPQPSDLIRPLNEASPTTEVVAPLPSSPATAISDEAEQVSSTTEIWRTLQSQLITEILEPASSPPIVEPSLWPPISPPRTEPQALPLSSSSAKEVVAESFEDVPRELVLAYDGHSIHKNVGEVPPAGISILLSELGGIDDRDIFVDIGSGLGNAEALVVLSTNIYRAVGIEAQEQVQTAGIQAINKVCTHGRFVTELRSFVNIYVIFASRARRHSQKSPLYIGTMWCSSLP
ncbi:S-adenosyl-L-methionine-dependent methyltransferase [Phytophthora cactorum]|nr:S-adenosyl-L-methionine-dependent methyltransferase [Phytophthora cactorum]